MKNLAGLAFAALALLSLGACTIVTHPAPGAQAPTAAQPAATPPATTAPPPAAQPPAKKPGRFVIPGPGRFPGGKGPATPGPNTTGPVKMTGSNMFGAQSGSPTALKGDVFWIPAGTTAMPDLDKLAPATTLYAEVLNSPERDFTEGFPGVDPNRLEWFAIRYTGQFVVATAGDYTFKLLSKDGAKVYVDNQLIVDNDGQHAAQDKSGPVKLTAGQHALKLDYFMGAKGKAALVLSVIGPDKQEKPWLPAF